MTEETEVDWNELRQWLREGKLFFPRPRMVMVNLPDGIDWEWERMMTPEEIALALNTACPTCAEQPGDPCRIWPDRTVLAEPHPMRYDSGQFVLGGRDQNALVSTLPLTDAEIEATGLV